MQRREQAEVARVWEKAAAEMVAAEEEVPEAAPAALRLAHRSPRTSCTPRPGLLQTPSRTGAGSTRAASRGSGRRATQGLAETSRGAQSRGVPGQRRDPAGLAENTVAVSSYDGPYGMPAGRRGRDRSAVPHPSVPLNAFQPACARSTRPCRLFKRAEPRRVRLARGGWAKERPGAVDETPRLILAWTRSLDPLSFLRLVLSPSISRVSPGSDIT